jgi:anhydro-N-acetylmuramic acid kinase
VPAFHQAIFGSTKVNRAIVNIGGIANITYLGKNGDVLGFDTGPGNMLLDSWTKLKIDKDYDKNGDWAASGVVLQTLLSGMLAEPYFALNPPKSTGRDLFNEHWLKQHQLYPHLRPQDVARTLVALTVHTIHDAIAQNCDNVEEVYVCGGGAHNALLMSELKNILGSRLLTTTDALGVGVDWVEAAAFAWLAKQTIDNKPSNLPAVTGAKGLRVLGAVFPK